MVLLAGLQAYSEGLFNCSSLTQDSHHYVVSQNLDGSPGEKVEGCENVPTMHQRVTWWGMGGLEAHRQCSQTSFGRSTECLATLKQTCIQMKTDISLQALWKALQYLQRGEEREKDRRSIPHGEEEKEGRMIAGF